MLDVNNIYVSSINCGEDPEAYLERVPAEAVRQMHLAGFEDTGAYLLDSHSEAVWPEVWDLYRKAVARFGAVPTCIEWDNQIPPLSDLVRQAEVAQGILQELGEPTLPEGRSPLRPQSEKQPREREPESSL